jgi:hypothetical protein
MTIATTIRRPDPPPDERRPAALGERERAGCRLDGGHTESSPKPRTAQAFRPPERHRRVARFIGYALAAGDCDLFVDGTAVLVRHLDTAERVRLAYLALLSLPRTAAEAVVDATVSSRAAPYPDPAPDPWAAPWVAAEFARLRAERDRREPLGGGRR